MYYSGRNYSAVPKSLFYVHNLPREPRVRDGVIGLCGSVGAMSGSVGKQGNEGW